MKSWTYVIVLLVMTFTAKGVSGISSLYPRGLEAVYSYSAEVSVETQLPAAIISQFKLMGELKIYRLEEHVRVQLHNLKYFMYSGENNKTEHNISLVDLPTSASELFEPFDLYYNDGKVDKIIIKSGESSWIKSVKKALSGILQLDLKGIDMNDQKLFNDRKLINSKEKSLYGECAMSYIIEPFEDGAKITKQFSLLDCDSELTDWSNVELGLWPHSKILNYELLTSNKRAYTVVKEENRVLIKEIISEGKTFTLINKNSPGSFMISVRQNMTLQALNEDFKLPQLVNPVEIQSLAYDTSEFYSFKFSTNEDLTGLGKKVMGLLSAIVVQLEAPGQLSPEQTNPQQAILIPLLITHLRKLDFDLLDNVFAQLKQSSSQTVRELFIKTLPLVGSKDSSIYILNLIKKNEVNDNDACFLLFSLTRNIRQISEESLLEDYAELINLPDNTSQSVKNSALLSFATLIHKTCKNNKCQSETLQKYITGFLQVLKDGNTDNAQKELYLSALNNIQLREILAYLKILIYDDVKIDDQYLRELAMRAVYPIVSKDPDEVFEVYWPILSNPNNSLDERSSALRLIMESGPNMSNLLQINAIISKKQCSDLFNLYFSIVKTYGEEDNDCFHGRSENARRLLRIISKPNYSPTMTAYFKYVIGANEIEVSSVENPQTRGVSTVEVRLTSQVAGFRVQYLTVNLKVIGDEGRLLKFVIEHIKDPSKIRLQDLPSHLKPTEIKLVAYSEYKVILLKSYNGPTIRSLFTDMTNIFGWRENQLHIASDFSLEKFFVTDLGMPGVLSADFPTLSKLNWKIKEDDTNLMDLNLDLRKWMQGSSVFKVKNTVVNIWQGIVKTHITRFNLPLSSSLNGNLQSGLNLTWSNLKGAGGSEIGIKWQTKTDVFTVTYSNNYDALSSSCPSCSSLTPVTNQRASFEQLSEDISANYGYSIRSKIFDCEDDGSSRNVRSLLNSLSEKSLHPSIEVLLTGGRSLETRLNALPISGSCGYASVMNVNEEIKQCVNIKHASHSDGFKWNNAKYGNQFDVVFGSSSSIDKECILNHTHITVNAQEDNVEGPEDVCYVNKCDVKETQQEFQHCTLGHTSTPGGNKRIILSINSTKLSESMEVMLCKVIDILKNVSLKYDEDKSTLNTGEAIFKIIFNNQDSLFTIDLANSSTHTVFNRLQFNNFNYYNLLCA